MYVASCEYVRMKRTTIDLDEALVAQAKQVLGLTTTRATVEAALRRVVEDAEADGTARANRQRADLRSLGEYLDLAVLAGDDAWR